MRGGAGSRSILIDNLRGRRIIGHRKWGRVDPISDKTSQIAIGLPSGATRPLPGHSGATLFKEILTEIIFCKLVSFPTTFEKESLCIPVLENSILMQF